MSYQLLWFKNIGLSTSIEEGKVISAVDARQRDVGAERAWRSDNGTLVRSVLGVRTKKCTDSFE